MKLQYGWLLGAVLAPSQMVFQIPFQALSDGDCKSKRGEIEEKKRQLEEGGSCPGRRPPGQTSLKWYSTIAVLSGTLAPAGTFLKNNDKICPAD